MAIDLDFCVDESKNKFRLLKEISRGGQGAVFQPQYPNIVLKLELKNKQPLPANDNSRKKFLLVRTLPIPRTMNTTLPMNILEKVSGYTMPMMDDMIPFDYAFPFKEDFRGAENNQPSGNLWLENLAQSDSKIAGVFFELIKHGGLRRFFRAYLYAAQMLSEIHGAGLVYCDFSHKNIFISKDIDYCNVWLIDSDNLDYQKNTQRYIIYTPHIGAPELHAGTRGCTFYSDSFAFASTMFQQLTAHHPFDGSLFDEKIDELGREEAEAYRDCGNFPWVFDSEYEENFWEGGEIFLEFIPPTLMKLFDATFGKDAGLFKIIRRPSMSEWSFALAQTVDEIICCPQCQMDRHGGADKCSWCDSEHPALTMSTKFEAGGELWNFAHEISKGVTVEVPLRIVHGYRAAELDEVAFKFTWKDSGFEVARVSEKFFTEFEAMTIARMRAATFETSAKKFFIHCTDTQDFKTTIEVIISNATD